MTKEQRQAELDELKWKVSEEKGYDCCGEFDYCAKCDKDIEFPCAVAYDKFSQKPAKEKTEAKKPAAAKPAVKKTTATTAKKTSTTKK